MKLRYLTQPVKEYLAENLATLLAQRLARLSAQAVGRWLEPFWPQMPDTCMTDALAPEYLLRSLESSSVVLLSRLTPKYLTPSRAVGDPSPPPDFAASERVAPRDP